MYILDANNIAWLVAAQTRMSVIVFDFYWVSTETQILILSVFTCYQNYSIDETMNLDSRVCCMLVVLVWDLYSPTLHVEATHILCSSQ